MSEQNYILGKQIYKDTNKSIYQAINRLSGHDVIVKIFHDSKNSNSRLIREIGIPKMLDHENIIKPIEHFTTMKKVYIIYPKIDNAVSLNRLPMDNFMMDQRDKFYSMVKIMIQVSKAIEHMHQRNIIHRDIKPANIIIAGQNVLLIDFDLSAKMNSTNSADLTDSTDSDGIYSVQRGHVGTPNYMAPEIWWRVKNINYKSSDIYSLGITMYYVFNKKKLPYKPLSISDLEYKISNYKPTPSKSGYPELDAHIMKMIDKIIDNRPSIVSTIEFLENLLVNLGYQIVDNTEPVENSVSREIITDGLLKFTVLANLKY